MQQRRFPMSKPAGHVPPIPRYTARPGAGGERLVALFVGVQSSTHIELAASAFEQFIAATTTSPSAPAYLDRASFVDRAGYDNRLAAMYWPSLDAYQAWTRSPFVRDWRARSPRSGYGTWWEPVATRIDRMETIAFKEFLRGVSACPFSRLEPTTETGYWGAARDRIPASAYDQLAGSATQLAFIKAPPTASGSVVSIKPPRGLTIIRSGVSWEACGDEQLASYELNVRPKLDAGMAYLIDNPLQSGCCSLRQVVAHDKSGVNLKEAYSLGAFLSLAHLEDWSKHHPTHLAIYHRALTERKKFQDALQLRTYNEIYVLDDEALTFDYVNCHAATGLIHYFPATATAR